ncbi:hypothetical protein [Hydrocarboniphaga sp.]|uniref:hypothetical protein n=1 Tax=Hydrocarboniphaga sp. TaxID=2033016 RepID=UPI003D141052
MLLAVQRSSPGHSPIRRDPDAFFGGPMVRIAAIFTAEHRVDVIESPPYIVTGNIILAIVIAMSIAIPNKSAGI